MPLCLVYDVGLQIGLYYYFDNIHPTECHGILAGLSTPRKDVAIIRQLARKQP
jgi:hypothetical protein